MSDFLLGEHVRVELTGERDALDLNADKLSFLCGGVVRGHLPEHQGRTGRVYDCGNGVPCFDGSRIGHGIAVVYDDPYWYDSALQVGGHFAAHELQPVKEG